MQVEPNPSKPDDEADLEELLELLAEADKAEEEHIMRIEPDVLHTPWGTIHYYPNEHELVAFCTQAGHGDCRLRRKATKNKTGSRNPKALGQGRPVARLCCWLRTPKASQYEHMNHTQWAC